MDGGARRWIGGCAGDSQDNPIIDRMMLRFRPIAPKPAAGFSSAADFSSGNNNLLLSVARKKRKYTRVRKSSEVKKRNRRSEEERKDLLGNSVATLQLLPETTEPRESRFPRELNRAIISETVTEKWPPLQRVTMAFAGYGKSDPEDAEPPKRAAESWVTVERVTDTCMEARGLGRTDVERLDNLERDTCPGFVSDGWDRVRWVNGAYRILVSGDEKSPPEIAAWLVTKERLPYLCPSFTCRVRLQYTCQDESKTKTLTAPCDVWRMDGGGLAWRLDINAALTLGLETQLISSGNALDYSTNMS